MIPARSMVRVLATLLLSARFEAFSLHPVHRRGTFSTTSKAATAHRSAAPAAQQGTSVAVAPSLWTEASGRGRSTALGMSVDTVAEVTVTDLQDREFQVTCPERKSQPPPHSSFDAAVELFRNDRLLIN